MANKSSFENNDYYEEEKVKKQYATITEHNTTEEEVHSPFVGKNMDIIKNALNLPNLNNSASYLTEKYH